jgi:sterol desaturase/sphingolipid hydroxylase (fatty acid hydroxylase superfamily)
MVAGGPAMGTRGHSVRLFENDLLERLSRVHPLTPLLLWAPIIAGLLWRSLAVYRLEVGTLVWLAAAGLLVWTLTEYLLHRFVFHLESRSLAVRRLVFVVHGVHHETPDDPTRLLMPPAPAIVACSILYAIFWTTLGRPWVEPFFAFFLMGYLAYDYIHFAVHHGRPRTRVGRFLRRWHMLHHFVTPEARWGVSSPLWDHVFRTAARR